MTLIAQETIALNAGTGKAAACRLCGGPAAPLFSQVVLSKHPVKYFQCANCDLIQSEQPYWLDEAYSHAIAAADTGAIIRNALTMQLTSVLASVLGLNSNASCLDFGGGHGVFVRMMRDRGWPFAWFDTYADNLYASGFEGDPSAPHDLVTAFEVLEHLVDVGKDLQRIFSGRPSAVLISTMLHRGHEPGWWYYAPHTGQHVAFYSRRTIQFIAKKFGYSAAGGRAYTLFIRNDAPFAGWRKTIARILVAKSKGNSTHPLVAALGHLLPRPQSLTLCDLARFAAHS